VSPSGEKKKGKEKNCLPWRWEVFFFEVSIFFLLLTAFQGLFADGRGMLSEKLLFYWFFSALVLAGVACGDPSTVRLPLQHGEFAGVRAGSPGRVLSLRLHAGCNDTVLLFHGAGELATFSQTFAVPPGLAEGSEVFAMGGVLVELPIRLTAREAVDPALVALWNFRAGFDGVLCLGPESGLWEHWTGFAWGPSDLLLGRADSLPERAAYMLQGGRRRFAVAPASKQLSGFAVAHGEQVGEGVVRFDTSSPVTLLPPDCFARLHALAGERGGARFLTDVEISVYEPDEHAWYSFALPGSLFSQQRRGFDMPLSTFAPNPPAESGPGEFVLGRNLLGNFVLLGAANGTTALLPSYKLLDRDRRHAAPHSIHDGSSLEAASSVCTAALVLLYFFVVADLLAVPARTCARPLMLGALACVVLVFWTYHAGFAQYRFFAHFLFLEEDARDPAYEWFAGWVLFCCGVVAVLWGADEGACHVRNAALESALALTIWFTQVDCTSTGSVFELFSLAFIAAMHTWVRNVSLLSHPSLANLAGAAVANVFFVWLNVAPLLRRFWPASPHNAWTAAYVWWTCSPVVSWFLFGNLLASRAFATASRRLGEDAGAGR